MALSLVPSACCAPIVLALLSLTAARNNALFTCALLACYAIGHCMPLCAFMLGAGGWERVLRQHARVAGVIGASITLAMSGYYAILV
jgi:cytochrome c biogenesis protein CcdA